MPALRFRYSLRTMLLLMTAAVVGIYWVMLPTRRADQFAQAIRSGHYDAAQAMVPSVFSEREERAYFSKHSDVTIEPISALQLWNGTRTVTVHDFVNYHFAEFTITRNGDSSSAVFLPYNGPMFGPDGLDPALKSLGGASGGFLPSAEETN